MKILVTGHRGFIGSNMVRSLNQHDVITYEWGEPMPEIKGLDWVIHIGAISSTTERDVNKIMTQNYDFSCQLLDQCIEQGVNFQYSSSASVYGLNKEFKETSAVDPRTPYAWSKYMFERYAAKKASSSIHIQGFRYFNVYGQGEEHKGSQASPYTQFKQQAKLHSRITLFTNSDAYWRDFVPVERVVDIHQRFLHITESGLWNIGTGQVTSFEQVARDTAADSLCAIYYKPMPKELEHSYQSYTCADLTHLNNTLEKYNAMD